MNYKPRLHSETLPRVDKGLENWTTTVQLSKIVTTQPTFASDMFTKRDHSKGGGRILPHTVKE